jgi:site-specific recombinase XerD
MTLEKGLAAFVDAMLGKNRSAGTLRAYRTDIRQFSRWREIRNC